METLTLVISAYGALLATILAVREFRRQKRRIRIFLDELAFHHRVQLMITNIGHRPITIVDVSLAVGYEHNGNIHFEDVRRGSLLPMEFEDPLPATLGDGEHVALPLLEQVGNGLIESHMSARITVYDADGNEYHEFRTRLFNEKWGSYSEWPP